MFLLGTTATPARTTSQWPTEIKGGSQTDACLQKCEVHQIVETLASTGISFIVLGVQGLGMPSIYCISLPNYGHVVYLCLVDF